MRINKNGKAAIDSNLIMAIEAYKGNPYDLQIRITHGADSVTFVDDVLQGGHFKILSILKQAGFTPADISEALG
jgi:hypothetical protein